MYKNYISDSFKFHEVTDVKLYKSFINCKLKTTNPKQLDKSDEIVH